MKSFALALLLILALAVPALAQGPSQDGYTPDGPQVIEQTDSGGDPNDSTDPSISGSPDGSPSAAGAGSLPFTGMDLVLIAAFGAGLLGVGVGMRRLTRPADPTALPR